MSHQYTKATFNTDGQCFIVPMTDEEVAEHLAFVESISGLNNQVVASEALPDDKE